MLDAVAGYGKSTTDAELRQYESLTETLTPLNRRDAHQAKVAVAGVAEDVENNRGQTKHVAVLRAAEGIRDGANHVVNHLRWPRLRVQAAADEAGHSAAIEQVKAMMLGHAGEAGAADTFQRHLNGYVRYIQQFAPEQPKQLASDVQEEFGIGKNLRGGMGKQRFVEFYVEGCRWRPR